MNDATRIRPVERVSVLLEKFKKNLRITECAVFQNKSGFPLQIPMNDQNDRVYFKETKKGVLDKNSFSSSK